MNNSLVSEPVLEWNAMSIDNCMWMQTPGRYLLRKSNWNNPKHYTSLTGIWDKSCGRIKLYVTDKEEFLTEDQQQQQKKATGACEHASRKMLVHILKHNCVTYNNLVDGVAAMTRNRRISKTAVRDYKEVLFKIIEDLNTIITKGYDCFALEKEGDTLDDLAATLFKAVLRLQEALLTNREQELSPPPPKLVRQTKRKMKESSSGGVSGGNGKSKRSATERDRET